MTRSDGQGEQPDVVCLLADDNRAITAELCEVLPAFGIEVAGVVSSGVQALAMLERIRVTVLVAEPRMPDLGGLDLARLVIETATGASVIFYTSHADSWFMAEALESGVRAVVRKQASHIRLVEAIHSVRAGETYVDRALGGA
jgi:DNA-binding NarL/FixJ family response regulator